MKKSKIDPEELLEDTNKLLELLDKIENSNLETLNLKKVEKDINILGKEINKKYNKFTKEESKDNLDTKK